MTQQAQKSTFLSSLGNTKYSIFNKHVLTSKEYGSEVNRAQSASAVIFALWFHLLWNFLRICYEKKTFINAAKRKLFRYKNQSRYSG